MSIQLEEEVEVTDDDLSDEKLHIVDTYITLTGPNAGAIESRPLCGAPLSEWRGTHSNCPYAGEDYEGSDKCPGCGRPVCGHCRLLDDIEPKRAPYR